LSHVFHAGAVGMGHRAVLLWTALLFVAQGCVVEGMVNPNLPDGGPSLERDAEPLPMWRDRGRGEGGVARDASCASDGAVPRVDAGPPPPPCNEVTFRYVNPGASSVWVSGTFTPRPGAPAEWARNPSEGALVMVNDGAGVWTVTTRIEP